MLIMTKTPTIRQQSAALIPDYEAAVVSSSFRKGLECEGLTRENKRRGGAGGNSGSSDIVAELGGCRPLKS